MSADLLKTRMVLNDDKPFKDPIVIGGFVSSTPAGVLSLSYMIEQLGLDQVGHMRSFYIPPVAVFVGKKLRNPFRIYTNGKRDLVVLICETQIEYEGLYEIGSVIVEWLQSIKPSDIMIIDGDMVPVPVDDGHVYGVAGPDKLQIYEKSGIKPANSALIGGVGGAIMNQCIEKGISSSALITEFATSIPDPDGALRLISALNDIYSLDIPVDVLQKSVNELHKQLKELSDNIASMKPGSTGNTERMYG